MATLQTWGQVLGGQVSLGKSIAAAFLACLPAFHVTEAWSGADSIPEPPRRPALPSARPEAVETQATETEAVDPSEPSSERKTYRAFPVLADGRMGPELNLRPLFEQFVEETGRAAE